jgi:DUF1365 family protein
VDERLREAGLTHAGARIELLTMPRQCGYAFNPLSVYFCYDHRGRIAAVIYEVHNTFGERHSYVIGAAAAQSGTIHQAIEKSFYVSPFLDMDLTYKFRVHPPGESVAIAIGGSGITGEPVINTALHGTRTPLTTAGLLRECISHPLLTLKVIGGIHWEALRLFSKGVRVRPRSPMSGHGASFDRSMMTTQGDNG